MTITHTVLITALFTFILGFYTWKTNPKNPLNITFGIFALTVGSWVFLNFLFQNYPSAILLKAIYAFGPIIIANGFLWINFLVNKELPKNFKSALILLYILTFILSISQFFDGFMIKSVTNRYEYQTGPYFLIYSIVMVLLFVSFITYIYYIYSKSDKLQKIQLKYIAIGMAIVVVTAAVVSFILPALFGYSKLNFLDSASSIIFILFAFFSIIRHQLLDIKVMITEVLVYFLLVAVFTALFLTEGQAGLVFRLFFMAALIYGSYLLINSVKKEVYQKEELQRLSGQLALANDHLKELDAMKTEFVSLASHELLTPVSAIEGYLSMLLDEKMAKVEDPKAQKYLKNVYSSAKRLARLVADMLNISRIEEGRLLVQKKELDLSKLIKDVITEIKFKAEEHQQKIVFDNPDGWNTIGDPDKIKEVVINIIGNAIKYSKNPGTINIHVTKIPTPWVVDKWQKIEEEIKARPLDDQEAIKSVVDSHFRDFVGPQQLLIAIKDEGIGIPKEELPRLFKKFHRVGDFTTAESQGTGLGLYISRALVELHHGRIWADSEGSGKGSTFTFSLPDISSKKELSELEGQVHQEKEQLKPLARPVKEAEEI